MKLYPQMIFAKTMEKLIGKNYWSLIQEKELNEILKM